MSKFTVDVVQISSIENIENADSIELVGIGEYRCVVRKGEFKPGDVVVYIPEASIVPQWLLEKLNLVGKLAGPEKNRVKAIKLRGVLSQGLVYPLEKNNGEYLLTWFNRHTKEFHKTPVRLGEDVKDLLNVIKYEPPIPPNFGGDVYNAGTNLTVAYDIENFKKYPEVLQDGELVVITEKIHGTFCGVGLLPKNNAADHHYRHRFVVFSKGLGAQGLCFKDNETNKKNVYLRTLEKYNVFDRLLELEKYIEHTLPLFVLGEVYGKNIQDLNYNEDLGFRIFDVAVGYRNQQRFMCWEDVCTLSERLNIKTVPELYRGPFDKTILRELTSGKETISGKNVHIREGVVVKPLVERFDFTLGRVILKSVSTDYLLRKGNTTEYQ